MFNKFFRRIRRKPEKVATPAVASVAAVSRAYAVETAKVPTVVDATVSEPDEGPQSHSSEQESSVLVFINTSPELPPIVLPPLLSQDGTVVLFDYGDDDDGETSDDGEMSDDMRWDSTEEHASDSGSCFSTPSPLTPSPLYAAPSIVEIENAKDLEPLIIGTMKHDWPRTAVFDKIVARRGNDICLTKAMVQTVVAASGETVDRFRLHYMRALLDNAKRRQEAATASTTPAVEDGVLDEVLEHEPFGMAFRTKVLLDFWCQSDFPDSILQKIVCRSEKAVEVLEMLLLDRRSATNTTTTPGYEPPSPRPKITLNKEWVIAAVENGRVGAELLELLFRERRGELQAVLEQLSPQTLLLKALQSPEPDPDVVKVLVAECANKITITPRMVETACGLGSPRMLQHLLDTANGALWITTRMVETAATNNFDGHSMLLGAGDEMLDALLKQKRCDIQLTRRLVEPAFNSYSRANEYHLRRLGTLLGSGHRLRFSREAVRVLTYYHSGYMENDETLGITHRLVEDYGDDEHVREALLIRSINNLGSYHPTVLLEQEWASPVHITERIVSASSPENAEWLLEQLLDKYGDAVCFDRAAIEAIMRRCSSRLVERLLQGHVKVDITPRLMESVAHNENKNGADILKLLLRERGDEVQITENFLRLAVRTAKGNGRFGPLRPRAHGSATERADYEASIREKFPFEYLPLILLRWRREEVLALMSEDVVEDIVSNRSAGCEYLNEFILKFGDAVVTSSQKVLAAAARNPCEGLHIFEYLLQERGAETEQRINTEAVLEAVVRNEESAVGILELFRRKRPGGEVTITARVLEAAAGNKNIGHEVMAYLFLEFYGTRGSNLDMSGAVLEAASKNKVKGAKIIEIIFSNMKTRADHLITTKAITAAACNERYGRGILKQFLKRKGADVEISPDILEDAIRGWWHSEGLGNWQKRMAALLMKRYKGRVMLTEGLVEACYEYGEACYGHGNLNVVIKPIIRTFVRSRPQDIRPTEKLVARLACAWPRLFEELLHPDSARGGEIRELITPRVLEDVVAGSYDGVVRFVEASGCTIPVSSRLVEVAAGNEGWGWSIVQYFLEGNHGSSDFSIFITPGVMRAVVGNAGSGKGILKFLLQRHRQQQPGLGSGSVASWAAIDEGMIRAAVGNEESGEAIIDMLLEESGDKTDLTDAMIEASTAAAAGDRPAVAECGERIRELFRVRTVLQFASTE